MGERPPILPGSAPSSGVLGPADVQYFETNWPCSATGANPMLISPAAAHEAATKYMIAFLDIYLVSVTITTP